MLVLAMATVAVADTSGDDRQRHRLSIFRVTLHSTDAHIDAPTRRAAATELLSLDTPEANTILLEAMRSSEQAVQSAVYEAMAAHDGLDPALLDAAVAQLPDATDTSDVLARMLARAAGRTPDVVARLHATAANGDLDDARRVNVIRALGEFRHTPVHAAAALITLLESASTQPPPVLDAAMTSLSALTGLPASNDVQTWTRWWETNRNRPAERWLEDMVQALSSRVATLERDAHTNRSQVDHLAQRLLTVHRDLWPLMGVQAQVNELNALLTDDLEVLRLFGLERAAVLLRDGNATDATHAAVLARLNDPSAAVRTACVKLLPELPEDAVQTAVASRLHQERDASVANALLTWCAATERAQVPVATLAGFLPKADTCQAATAALWPRTNATLSDEDRSAVQDAIAAATLSNPEARLDLLSASLGDDDAATRIEAQLDGDDPTARADAAEALRRGGRSATVLERATDAALFPVVLRILQDQGTIDGFTSLMALQPQADQIDAWRTALLQTAAAIPMTDRVEVDQQLSTVDGITPSQRIALLSSATAPEQPLDLRLSAAAALVDLLAATGDDRAIMALVDAIPVDHRTDDLDDAAFLAALRAKAFDDAATIRSVPRAWVVAFEGMQAGRPELADLLRTEIVRRFNDDLDAALRSRLGMADDPLMGDATDPPGA